MSKKLTKKTNRRTFRIRNKFTSKGKLFRVSVSRSLKQIGAQIIDDSKGVTIVGISSLSIKDGKGSKKDIAKQVGLALGKMAKDKSVEKVFFDRGRFRYHGRVAALAEGLRESGLKF